MGLPVVSVDSTGGSSDTTASGAGPGTSISGSTGRTRNTASQLHFGLFGATDDISGVATDGTATLYFAVSTAGQRNHSSIAGLKNTRHVDIGSITSGAAVLSAIVSTSGWTVGDVIKVTGAGAAGADLYSTILTVDSSVQVTLNDNAGTTVVAAVVENPKQFTLTTSQGVNTGTTDTAWATGGKRATIAGTNSKKLFENNSSSGDAMPGWAIEMQSGHSETISATITFRRAGDVTSGGIELRGVSGAGTLPLLTFSNNGNSIGVAVAFICVRDFELRNSNATKTASTAFDLSFVNQPMTIIGIKVAHSTNKYYRGIGSGQGAFYVENCEFGYCANAGILHSNGAYGSVLINNYIHDCGSDGVNWAGNPTGSGMTLIGNIIARNAGHGVVYPMAQSASGVYTLATIGTICGNTIDANTGDGFRCVSNSSLLPPFFNNILSNNGGYGLNFTTGSDIILAAFGQRLRNNSFYNNTSGATNPSSLPIMNLNSSSGNPTYTNASSHDFSLGTPLKAAGYPLGGSQYVGKTSATYSYIEPGAVQRQEASAFVTSPFPGGQISGL